MLRLTWLGAKRNLSDTLDLISHGLSRVKDVVLVVVLVTWSVVHETISQTRPVVSVGRV